MPPTFGLFVLMGLLWKFTIVTVPISFIIGVITFFVFRFLFRKQPNKKINLPVVSGMTVVVFLMLVCACSQFIFPLMDFSSQISPAKSDFLIGTWVPTDTALKKMAESNLNFSTHRITINQDGTLSMTNIPSAWINPHTNSTLDFYTGDGKWEIVEGKEKKVQVILNSSDSPIQLDWLYPTSEFGMNLIYFRLRGTDNFASFEKCGAPFLRMEDERFTPLWKALSKIDRDKLGFTPISTEERVEITGIIGETDISLAIYGDTSRSISFKKDGNSYEWIYEDETYEGKDKWTDYDGALWTESIFIGYQTEEINGFPLNTVFIDYTGRDPIMLDRRFNFTLQDVKPILEEWRIWRQSLPPRSVSLCP